CKMHLLRRFPALRWPVRRARASFHSGCDGEENKLSTASSPRPGTRACSASPGPSDGVLAKRLEIRILRLPFSRQNMYAVIKTGGKQYRVAQGDKLRVEKLPGSAGEKVTFQEVLLIGGDTPKIGRPLVAGASVAAEITGQG